MDEFSQKSTDKAFMNTLQREFFKGISEEMKHYEDKTSSECQKIIFIFNWDTSKEEQRDSLEGVKPV
jgi:hypothetical protein